MKLKSMYTCIARHPETDSPYEPSEGKTLQTKKSHKPSKRNALKSKGQPQPKSPKTPLDSPTKTSSKISSYKRGATRTRFFSAKEKDASLDSDCINNNLPRTNSERKFSTDFTFMIQTESNGSMGFQTNTDAKKPLTPKMEEWNSVKNTSSSLFETKNKDLEKSSICLNSDNFDDLTSSHDDVFTGTDSPTWLIGDDDWKSTSFSSMNKSEERNTKLIKNFKIKDVHRNSSKTSSGRLVHVKSDSSGNLNAHMTRNCVSVNGVFSPYQSTKKPVSRTDSISSLSTERQITTSVDRATDSLEALRSLCAKERLPRNLTFQQRYKTKVSIRPPPRRALSTSPTTTIRDIPPLIPPREPIRSTFSPHQRHASSPSNTSLLTQSPRLAKSKTRYSISAQNETSRPKYQTQTSTTPVFSAMPPSLTRSNPVIRPIMKDGTQASHTHYYLLGDDESSLQEEKTRKSREYDPLTSIPRPKPKSKTLSLDRSNVLPPPRPPPPPASFYSTQSSLEHDDLERACSLPLPNQMSAIQSRNCIHGRLSPSLSSSNECLVNEKSKTVPRQSAMSSSQMINILQSQVFGVTIDECHTALSKNNWNILKSLNYLKVEQLFRVGLTTREHCQTLLQTTKGDLQSASQMLLEQHYKSQKTRS